MVFYFYFFWLLIVIEAKGEEKGAPKVVERWGEPDSSRAVVAASIVDRELDPVWIFNYVVLSNMFLTEMFFLK